MDERSLIKACFRYNSNVSYVTLILQVFICSIKEILTSALSIIFWFLLSISDLLNNKASYNRGTGV